MLNFIWNKILKINYDDIIIRIDRVNIIFFILYKCLFLYNFDKENSFNMWIIILVIIVVYKF